MPRNPISKVEPNPPRRTRTHVRFVRHSGRRRRYRPAGIDRYILEGRMEALWVNVRTVEQLRERFRAFVEDEKIWQVVEHIHEDAKRQQKNLDDLEKTCEKIAKR